MALASGSEAPCVSSATTIVLAHGLTSASGGIDRATTVDVTTLWRRISSTAATLQPRQNLILVALGKHRGQRTQPRLLTRAIDGGVADSQSPVSRSRDLWQRTLSKRFLLEVAGRPRPGAKVSAARQSYMPRKRFNSQRLNGRNNC
jgi:hypothetical protein